MRRLLPGAVRKLFPSQNRKSRKDKILCHVRPDEPGLEIGPSFKPTAPKKEGFNVKVLDHLSQEGLREKYKGHNVNIENIEQVDYVWNGERYSDLIGEKGCFSWIIASNLIEHVPDLILFLNDCDELLKDDGVLSLVVPDKRYCFDRFRQLTKVSDVIDAHINGDRIHTPGRVAEYFLNVVAKNNKISWNKKTKGDFKFVHGLENAKTGMKSVIEDQAYLDIHAWCFVPSSFRLLIQDLNDLGLICLKEVEFFTSSGVEFYITLSRNGSGVSESRMDMLKKIERELDISDC